MPIPKPNDNETERDFIARCMSDETMNREFPNNEQRAAICYSQWRAKQAPLAIKPNNGETQAEFTARYIAAQPAQLSAEQKLACAFAAWRAAKSFRPEMVVKFIRHNVVGAYGIIWGNPSMRDLQGEYFDAETDFMFDVMPPDAPRVLMMEHGFDPKIQGDVIGKTRAMEADEFGLWVESKLDERKAYRDYIAKLIEAGALSYSTGSAPQFVEKQADGRIARWGIIEASLTTQPAEPRLPDVAMLRSVYAAKRHEGFDKIARALDADTERAMKLIEAAAKSIKW